MSAQNSRNRKVSSYKCPRHHRTKNCEALFIFPTAQLAAARRAKWHRSADGLPQLKFVISLPPSAWFGRRAAPGTDSAKSACNSFVIEVFRRAAEVCRGCFFGIPQSVKEPDLRDMVLGMRTAYQGLFRARNSYGGAHLALPSLLALPQVKSRRTASRSPIFDCRTCRATAGLPRWLLEPENAQPYTTCL